MSAFLELTAQATPCYRRDNLDSNLQPCYRRFEPGS
jgi:hypothetical protein